MGYNDRRTLQDDQFSEAAPDGSNVRYQSIRVQEWWETIGADGNTYTSDATREDVIYKHLQSNAFLSDQRVEIARLRKEQGIELEEDGGVIGEPLCGVRHVVRYETNAVWEVASEVEPVDVLAEIANEQPCPHPPEKAMDGGGYRSKKYRFCGRCCERLPDLPEGQ